MNGKLIVQYEYQNTEGPGAIFFEVKIIVEIDSLTAYPLEWLEEAKQLIDNKIEEIKAIHTNSSQTK